MIDWDKPIEICNNFSWINAKFIGIDKYKLYCIGYINEKGDLALISALSDGQGFVPNKEEAE